MTSGQEIGDWSPWRWVRDRVDIGSTTLAVEVTSAIALGAVADLTRSRVVWAGSIVVGMVGAALLAWALM